MRKMFVLAATAAIGWLMPSVAHAVPSLELISGTGTLGAFEGSFGYDDGTHTVTVTLTNMSPAANGGFITGFVFNIPAAATGISSVLTPDGDFDQLGGPSFSDDEDAGPYGQFDIGAALGGSFEGGGNPNDGMGVGDSASFTFTLSGTGLGGLTASDFLTTLSVPPGAGEGVQGFVVRFRGFNNRGSDKVFEGSFNPEGEPIPEPATAMLLGLGLVTLSASRRRFRGR